jgi:hypothetical protein
MFAERLPELCHPHAQRMIRLQEALCQLGLALGGQAGAEGGEGLGLSGSRDTILRLVRHHPSPDPSLPRVIGLDDWAWKRDYAMGRSSVIENVPSPSMSCLIAPLKLVQPGWPPIPPWNWSAAVARRNMPAPSEKGIRKPGR